MAHYILDGQTPVPCDDLMTWARWFETADRHVAKTTIGEAEVSTVFLGIDYSFQHLPNRPVLFETMVFGGAHDFDICERCCTWEDAIDQHAEICRRIMNETREAHIMTGDLLDRITKR